MLHVSKKQLTSRLVRCSCILALIVLTAELTARLDDSMRFQIPVLDESSLDEALKITDQGITRGRPNGRYQRWKLNEYGFRSNSIDLNAGGKTKVLVLGASESFGMFESPGKSYVELLERDNSLKYVFLNASIVGMPASAMQAYWDNWLVQFKPDVVLILASPLFYLSDYPPVVPRKTVDAPKDPVTKRKHVIKSRFLERLRNHLSLPAPIQSWRQESKVKRIIDAHPDDWIFQNAPQDRLNLFKEHVSSLVKRISESGARIVLMTQPLSLDYPLRDEDYPDVLAAREIRPRASAQVVWDFSQACRTYINELGEDHGIECIDLWPRMTGERKYFADIVHFSDAGSQIIAEEVLALLSRQNP